MFIDEAEIYVRSGKGGNGMVHFHREKYVNRGGPDGGDGGKGGDIIFKATRSLNTLAKFRHQLKYIAEDGKKGNVSDQTGRSADDLIIPVPIGTLIYNKDNGNLMADLTDDGQQITICKGGRGGRGNPHFASARRQAPRIAEKGEPAEEKNLKLELKLIADVGIVGVPNAGKSSLLAAVTNAKPKIGDYPFTTLAPNLGVSNLDEDNQLVLADIPGLIEGAHTGAGLGLAFLRHVQRTRVLIHVLDGLSEDPVADFTQINSELSIFDPALAKKPQLVAFNKMDIPEVAEKWTSIKGKLEKKGYKVYPISTMTREGVSPMLWKALELLQTLPELIYEEQIPVYKPEADARNFEIRRIDRGWKVEGAAIERAAEMTYWEYDPSVRRFHKLIVKLGIDEALREAGVKEGDTVVIADYELEWAD